MKYLTNIDLNKNELQNAVIQNLASAPTGGVEGQLYYNTTEHLLYQFNGTAWVSVGTDSNTLYDLKVGETASNSVPITLVGTDGSIDTVNIVGAGGATISSTKTSEGIGSITITTANDNTTYTFAGGFKGNDYAITITPSTGTATTITLPNASAVSNGLMSKENFTKLSGIEEGAQVNIIDEDAPSDNKNYARKNGAWVEVIGAVSSVNGQTGEVVLDAEDVGADVAGAAAEVETRLKGDASTDYDTLGKLEDIVGPIKDNIFHLKGEADKQIDDKGVVHLYRKGTPYEIDDAEVGDTYLVGEEEWTWSKTGATGKWIMLGIATDLSDYYNKAQVDEKIGGVTGAFHFRGVALEEDPETHVPIIDPATLQNGDVWLNSLGEQYAWNGTEFIKLGYMTDLSAYANRAEVQKMIDSKLTGLFRYKGAVNTYADLPENPANGDVYIVKTYDGRTNVQFAWNDDAKQWDELTSTVDLSNYYTSEETDAEILKARNLAVSLAKTYTDAASDVLEIDINNIKGKIPAEASTTNQLADKAFVNSSIATETATFQGSFNLISDLKLPIDATSNQIANALADKISMADNNDYAFVAIPISATEPNQIKAHDRYKFATNKWAYEYTLNNSSFTAEQWAAINSKITGEKVTSYDAHLANKENPHEVTKAQVGLGDVDNTSDLDKPISTATQTALNAKVNYTDKLSSVTGTMTSAEQKSVREKIGLFTKESILEAGEDELIESINASNIISLQAFDNAGNEVIVDWSFVSNTLTVSIAKPAEYNIKLVYLYI